MKQRCVYKQFIEINDSLEVNAGFFIKQSEWGREQDSGETERVCVRERRHVTEREGYCQS